MDTSSNILDPSLPPDQARVVAALATGLSVTAAAARCGIHRATIYNWQKLPAFGAALQTSREQFLAEFQAELSELAGLAIAAIRQILTDPKASPSVRLKAALAVLDRPLFPKTALGIDTPAEPESATEPAPLPATKPEPPKHEIARNAACPCGSGTKYKRCCGINAPPILGRAA